MQPKDSNRSNYGRRDFNTRRSIDGFVTRPNNQSSLNSKPISNQPLNPNPVNPQPTQISDIATSPNNMHPIQPTSRLRPPQQHPLNNTPPVAPAHPRQSIDMSSSRPVAPTASQPQFSSYSTQSLQQPRQLADNPQPQREALFQQSNAIKQLDEIVNPPKKKFRLPRIPKSQVPKSKLKRFLKYAALAVGIILIITGASFGVYRQAKNNSPDKVFADAMLNNLQTKQVVVNTKSKTENSSVGFDFANSKNPVMYSRQDINTNGSITSSQGYGNTKNSYFRYSTIPSTIQPNLRTALLNAQVKVRENGSLPVNVPGNIIRATDPLYRMVGPILLSNLDQANSQKISKYLIDKKAYKYSKKDVVKQKYNGKTVLAYTTKLNINEIKTSNQSVIITMGFYPFEVEGVIGALDGLKDATLKMYISTGDHRLVATELTTTEGTITTTYDKYNQSSTPIEPQTRLSWVDYADAHYKMQADLAATRPLTELDIYRKNQVDSLKPFLQKYFSQANSYPSYANLNSTGWVRSNLLGVDVDYLRDPIATTLNISNTPRPGLISYSALGENGSANCDNTPINSCAGYKLTATLSNGQQYTVQAP